VSEHIHKRHNKSLFLYHIVCPAKYRRKVITGKVAKTLKDVCIGIDERYEIHFVEIGADEEHVHFLVQSLPVLSPRDIVQTIKVLQGKRYSKGILK
jgi:REP element-mobilizing transposase RayT